MTKAEQYAKQYAEYAAKKPEPPKIIIESKRFTLNGDKWFQGTRQKVFIVFKVNADGKPLIQIQALDVDQKYYVDPEDMPGVADFLHKWYCKVGGKEK